MPDPGTVLRTAALAAAFLAAACASAQPEPEPPPPRSPAAEARPDDDAAFAAGRGALAPMDGHWIAVGGGRVLGGALLLEDAARLLADAPGRPGHGYLFVLGTEGDRAESIPALYSPRIAGGGLLRALGLQVVVDYPAGTLTLGRGGVSRTFPFQGGAAAATLTVEPAGGLGPAREIPFLVSTGWGGTALISAEDAGALGLALAEIPGTVTLNETLSGRALPCRRASVRVTLEGMNGSPDLRASAVVEVLYPR